MFRAIITVNGEEINFDAPFTTEYVARVESMYQFEQTSIGRMMVLRNRNKALAWPVVAPYVTIEPIVGEWIKVDGETVPYECDEQNTLIFVDIKGGVHLGCWDDDAERFVNDSTEKTYTRAKVSMFFVIPEQLDPSV